jgi:amino acid transporter
MDSGAEREFSDPSTGDMSALVPEPGATVADRAVSDASTTAATSGTLEHRGRLAANALGLWGAVVVGLGSAAPTAGVALTLAALVAVNGYATPLTLIITGLPMLGVALAYRRLNQWRVDCGATYAWTARAVSPSFGFIVGWIMVLAYFLGVMSTLLPVGPYALQVVGGGLSNSTVAAAVAGSIAVGIVFVAAYVGIKVTARTQWILFGIEYGIILALAGFALVAVVGHNPASASFHWSWFSWKELGGVSGFVSGALIAVYNYSGWDSTINVNEETENARTTPGNAVVVSVIMVGLLEAVFAFIFQGAVHKGALEAHSASVLSYIGQVTSGSVLAKLAIIAVLLSTLGSTLGSVVAGSRIAFAMGGDRVLPPILSRTHPRFKTPSAATVLACVVGFVALWLYSLGSSSIQSVFSTVISSDGLLFALFYAATGIAMAAYFRRETLRDWRSLLEFAVIPLASAAFLLYISYRAVPANLGGWGSRNMIYLYVMLGIGIAALLEARFRRHVPFFFYRREVAPATGAAAPEDDLG